MMCINVQCFSLAFSGRDEANEIRCGKLSDLEFDDHGRGENKTCELRLRDLVSRRIQTDVYNKKINIKKIQTSSVLGLLNME